MTNILSNFKNFNFEDLKLTTPVGIQGGAYLTKIFFYS